MDMRKDRVDWVDYAKGFCIVMVVMMHSTLGVQDAFGGEGFMSHVVAFAKPFRMPDFFMISGLFLSRVIDREWRDYLDKKVVHFAYFYVLWLTIQFLFKAPGMAMESGLTKTADLYLFSFIEPFGTLWFIYMLPIFFVVTKLARGASPVAIWVIAAALQIAPIETGSTIIDEFCNRFVYFYTGYLLAPLIFRFAGMAGAHVWTAAAGLGVWALINGGLVYLDAAALPGIGLGLGLLGAMAVIAFTVLLSKRDWATPLRFAGRNSIVVYLAFFLPMASTRTLLLHLGFTDYPGLAALAVTAIGVITPLVLYVLVRDTRFRFLFARPDWARLEPRRKVIVLAE